MTTDRELTTKVAAIVANLAALNEVTTTVAERCAEAHELAESGECNGAIGALLDLDSILDEAKALYDVALALHRSKRLT